MSLKRIAYIFFLLLIAFSEESFAQKDSSVYHQEYALMFSNVYVFYSDNTFVHEFSDDSFGHTIGKGTYKDKGKTRILYFSSFDTTAYAKQKPLRFKFEQSGTRKLKFKKNAFTCKDYHGTVKSPTVKFIRQDTISK